MTARFYWSFFVARILLAVFGAETINYEAFTMIRNPTIQEFEAAATTRMLTNKRYKAHCSRKDASSLAIFAANSYLQDIEVNGELWCMARGKRTYIFHIPSMRIAGELGLVFDSESNDMCSVSRIVVLDRKGLTKCKSLADLVSSVTRRRTFNRNKRKERK